VCAEDDNFNADDLLFPPYEDEPHLPLFSAAAPTRPTDPMSGTASPINIATARQSSASPRNQQSNLTSQLQQPKIDVQHDMSADGVDGVDGAQVGRQDRQESAGLLGSTPYGAQSIPFKNAQRRESTANGLSGSYMGGISWGGISMGSFIRDDLMMTGTSPYNYGSPSFHSSSYLPKMEANYMKDYQCCDIHLASMHELLQHYEEEHAGQPTQTMGRTPRDLQIPTSRTANAPNTAQAVQQRAQNQPQQPLPRTTPQQAPQFSGASPMFSGQSHDQIGTFDSLDDMDMDDSMPATQMQQQRISQFQPQPHFGRQQPRGPSVNVNLANAFQGQGLNSAGPTTPHASQQGFQHNPTVSSVNTPTLGTGTSMSQQTITPESSMPGTPAEAEFDYNAQLANLNLDYNQLMQGNTDFKQPNNGGSGTIDDPAKRLLSKQGHGNKSLANSSTNNSELAKRVREQQVLNGLAGAGGFVSEEIKPFKCPVIGCEKTYKNQNGLKYHKTHGHQTQQLKENGDGTYSILDPTTQCPFPGTQGMEKEKPYRCEVCGKRYKNLNGLKYHRQHSPQCNPELKLSSNLPGAPGNMQGVNVAGAGLLDGMGY
jgi:transcription factor SFP1